LWLIYTYPYRRGTRKARKGTELSFGPPWSELEDQVLLRAVNLFGTNWDLISDVLSSAPHPSRRRRLPRQCLDRWKDVQSKSIGNPTAAQTPSGTATPTTTVPSIPTAPTVTASAPSTTKLKQSKKGGGLFTLLDLLDHRSVQRKKHSQRTTTPSTAKGHADNADKHSKQTATADPPAHTSHAQASLACGITPEKSVRTPIEVVLSGKRTTQLDSSLTPVNLRIQALCCKCSQHFYRSYTKKLTRN